MAEHPVSEPEEWRPVSKSPGYEVSSLGRVRSLDRLVFTKAGIFLTFRGKILSPRPGGTSPYLVVSLPWKQAKALQPPRGYTDPFPLIILPVRMDDREPTRFQHRMVHVLVCTAFHGLRPSQGYEVAHYDGDPLNNLASNLRWTTRGGNLADRTRHGTQLTGQRNHMAKLSEADVRKIRELCAASNKRGSVASIARRFGIHHTQVIHIRDRTSWKHLP